MAKIALDKYYTEDAVAKYCVNKTFEVLGTDWDRIIEPAVGSGSFLKFLPENTIHYDIEPVLPNTIKADYRTLQLPYKEKSLVIGNPPFMRANKGSVQFVKASMAHSPYVAFIQPVSQFQQNRTMKDTELLYSENLGTLMFSGRKVKVCFNIYHKCKDGHKQKWDIPGLIECRHIFRSGKYQHSDDILNDDWRFRVAAWGTIRLLDDDETCPNEVVFKCDDDLAPWLGKKLRECKYYQIMKYVTTPNLPAWRLRKWLYEEYEKEKKDE